MQNMGKKIRIFINVLPWSLGDTLHAYAIDPEDLLSVKIGISDQEAEYFKGGGIWALFLLRLKIYQYTHKAEFEDEWGDKHNYIGTLAEENKEQGLYFFTAYFKKPNSPPLEELRLPNKEKLKELGLI